MAATTGARADTVSDTTVADADVALLADRGIEHLFANAASVRTSAAAHELGPDLGVLFAADFAPQRRALQGSGPRSALTDACRLD